MQVQEQLVRERENYSALHDQHMQLRRQQEVLTAELMVALGSYKPKANIDAGACAMIRLRVCTSCPGSRCAPPGGVDTCLTRLAAGQHPACSWRFVRALRPHVLPRRQC